MADRGAWVTQAYRRYHAGQITLDQLLAMVRDHREDPETDTGNPDA